jgi:hypothetical protein
VAGFEERRERLQLGDRGTRRGRPVGTGAARAGRDPADTCDQRADEECGDDRALARTAGAAFSMGKKKPFTVGASAPSRFIFFGTTQPA